jgi:hypothetical protein
VPGELARLTKEQTRLPKEQTRMPGEMTKKRKKQKNVKIGLICLARPFKKLSNFK